MRLILTLRGINIFWIYLFNLLLDLEAYWWRAGGAGDAGDVGAGGAGDT